MTPCLIQLFLWLLFLILKSVMKSFKTETTTTLRSTGMAHLTVAGRNVAGVENALIQPFLVLLC